jgi:hypothetical protein
MTHWSVWLQGLPRITAAECAVVFAAVVAFYFVPAVVAWSDARRQRRMALQEAAGAAQAAPAVVPAAPGGEALPESPPAADLPRAAASPDEAWRPAPEPAAESVPAAEVPAATSEVDEPGIGAAPNEAARTFTPESATDLNAPGGEEIQPAEGPARHFFRLEELRRARLADWPPAVIRDDPERWRIWTAAEQAIEQHWARIGAARIGSPYPARSTCLGGAEPVGHGYRVHFLLFPVLWPVAEDQAVAQVIFEIDAASGVLRGWVDALRAGELTSEHRREIQSGGGDA